MNGTYFDANLLTYQIVASAVVVWVINKMKSSNLPAFTWIDAYTPQVNRSVAVIASGLVSLGIHWSYGFSAADGVFTLSVTGVTVAGILGHLKDWIMAYVTQQGVFKLSKVGDKPTAL